MRLTLPYTLHYKVQLALRHQAKPCIGEPCDLDAPCRRHRRTGEVVLRYVEMKMKRR